MTHFEYLGVFISVIVGLAVAHMISSAGKVILNRNDAKGPPGVWAQDRLYAYWAVSVTDEGPYDVEFVFHRPLPDDGNMVLRVGPVQRTLQIDEPGLTRIMMENIGLHKGDYLLESWFWTEGQIYLPFYTKISIASGN